MNKNIYRVFLLTSVILFLGLSAVCASDSNSTMGSMSDIEKVNVIEDNTVNEIADSGNNNIKEVKKDTVDKKVGVSDVETKRTLKTESNKKSLKSGDSYTVTNETFSNYFNEKKLKDSIAEDSTLDFKGLFNGSDYSMTIDRSVNMISSDKSAFIDLDGDEFVIEKTGNVNVTGITFRNSQIYVRESTNITFDCLNVSVENKNMGSGVGSTSVRDGSTNITVKNSNFYTENSGSHSTLVFAGVNCSTIENNTITGVGEVGNLLYLTTYNTGDYGIGMNSYNIIRNNRIVGPSSAIGFCYGICLTGHDNLIENNTVTYPGNAITLQWGNNGATIETDLSHVGNTYINNNVTGSFLAPLNSTVTGNIICRGTSRGNSTFTNNTFDSISLVGNDTFKNNTVNGDVSISNSNSTVDNNIIYGNIKASGTPRNNIITNNNYTGAIDSQLTDDENNNTVSDNNQIKSTEIIAEPSTVSVPVKKSATLNLSVLAENKKVTAGTLIVRDENNEIIERASLDDEETVTINLSYETTGVRTINVVYEGTGIYLASLKTVTVIVTNPAPSMEVITTKSRIGDLTTFKAKFTDSGVSGRVIFKVNGKTLKKDNGEILYSTVTDNEAVLEGIKVNSNWYRPHTTVTAFYGGNNIYNASTKTVSLEVAARESRIELKPQNALSGENVTLKANIIDASDESIIINEGRAVFKLNGRTIRDTNGNINYAKIVNGEITLDYKIPSTLKSGEYKLTCVFGHKIYERMDGNTTLSIIKE